MKTLTVCPLATSSDSIKFRSVQTVSENLATSLVRASSALGTFLDVARFLGIEPKQVFLWVAEVELPPEDQRRDIQERLRSLLAPTGSEA